MQFIQPSRDSALILVQLIADLLMDGECIEHGSGCVCPDKGDCSHCIPFDMTNDDAYETLHDLIGKSRAIIAGL